MSAVPEQFMTLQEYFSFEEASDVKHEYFHGAIFAMTGASEPHNLIVANLIGNLHAQLRGKSCRVYPGDLRVKIEATGLYTYPDIQVICGQPRYADARKDTVTNPSVIIEVLSPSTEGYDHGVKFQHYRTIETLQEYLMIAQDTCRVEHYLRQDTQHWLLVEITRGEQEIALKAIDGRLSLTDIYEDAGVPTE